MKYKVNQKELKRALASDSDHYRDLVFGLIEQFLGLRQPWTITTNVPNPFPGAFLMNAGTKFLVDAGILEEDKEVAANG